jgi:hypothetical protein
VDILEQEILKAKTTQDSLRVEFVVAREKAQSS